MKIFYQNAPLFSLPGPSAELPGELVVGNGYVTIVKDNGKLLTMEPTGHFRPDGHVDGDGKPDEPLPGHEDVWEKAQPSASANVVVFTPDVGGQVIPYAVVYRAA